MSKHDLSARYHKVMQQHLNFLAAECANDPEKLCLEVTNLTSHTAYMMGTLFGRAHQAPHKAALQFMAILCKSMQEELTKKTEPDHVEPDDVENP